VLKALSKQRTDLVFLAADCDPPELVMGLPGICEQKSVPFCFIRNQASLGRACDIKRSVIAAAITFKEDSPLASQILQMKDQIDQLLY
jgi:ribosomal protein L7Ae-like RNA K-turn-binding protein